MMKPVLGTNRFSDVKKSANILAETSGPDPLPLMVSMDVGQGRTIAYGGDTWVWYRASEESRLAHRKLWRQLVFWLSHKEDEGDNQVKVTLDRRRVALGEEIELTATARDAKGVAIPGVTYEGKVKRKKSDPPVSEKVEVPNLGEEGKGCIYAAEKLGEPGNYTVTVIAEAQRRGDRQRHGAVPGLRGRPRAGEPRRRSEPRPTDRRGHGGRIGHARAAGPLSQGARQDGIHRVGDVPGAPGLGQLAVPADLRHAPDPGVVALASGTGGFEGRRGRRLPSSLARFSCRIRTERIQMGDSARKVRAPNQG